MNRPNSGRPAIRQGENRCSVRRICRPNRIVPRWSAAPDDYHATVARVCDLEHSVAGCRRSWPAPPRSARRSPRKFEQAIRRAFPPRHVFRFPNEDLPCASADQPKGTRRCCHAKFHAVLSARWSRTWRLLLPLLAIFVVLVTCAGKASTLLFLIASKKAFGPNAGGWLRVSQSCADIALIFY